ncbi:hypothetical protein [Haloferula sp. BvORR071]|uniref:hypothetical protein n=1 Tax=Haloferula sp. BvORR071 TaxID=1396141 RepID=UPI000558A8DC|nr:hypothetical protein [Haloferula sp. BvORR071]
MPWISLRYFPGRTESDARAVWCTEIERDGRLTQKLRFHRFASKEEEQGAQESVLLSPDQLRELEARIAATDFEAMSRVHECDYFLEDMELMQWTIELGEGQIHQLSAQLISMEWLQRKQGYFPGLQVDAALQLWKAIDRLAPYNLERWNAECIAKSKRASLPLICPACQSSWVAEMIYCYPGGVIDIFNPSGRDSIVIHDREIVPGLPAWHCRDCGHEWGVSEWAEPMLEEERVLQERAAATERLAEARGVMDAVANEHGWVKCPHCGCRFSICHDSSWDGRMHKSCHTRLSIIGSGEGA